MTDSPTAYAEDLISDHLLPFSTTEQTITQKQLCFDIVQEKIDQAIPLCVDFYLEAYNVLNRLLR